MFSNLKVRMFNALYAVLVMIAVLAPLDEARAGPLSFDAAGAPLSSVSATLGSSFCFGCYVNTTLNPALDGIAFTLGQGQSATFDFFRITVGGFGGATGQVTAALGFDSPFGVSVVRNGGGAFVTLAGIVSAGTLVWSDPPSIVTGADGSKFSVDFSDIAGFTFGNSAQVTANVTVLAEATPPAPALVPEPSTIALLVLSLLLGIPARLYRRRAA